MDQPTLESTRLRSGVAVAPKCYNAGTFITNERNWIRDNRTGRHGCYGREKGGFYHRSAEPQDSRVSRAMATLYKSYYNLWFEWYDAQSSIAASRARACT